MTVHTMAEPYRIKELAEALPRALHESGHMLCEQGPLIPLVQCSICSPLLQQHA